MIIYFNGFTFQFILLCKCNKNIYHNFQSKIFSQKVQQDEFDATCFFSNRFCCIVYQLKQDKWIICLWPWPSDTRFYNIFQMQIEMFSGQNRKYHSTSLVESIYFKKIMFLLNMNLSLKVFKPFLYDGNNFIQTVIARSVYSISEY